MAPSTTRNDSCIGERGSCLNERIVDYSGRNSKPQITRHCLISGHNRRRSIGGSAGLVALKLNI